MGGWTAVAELRTRWEFGAEAASSGQEQEQGEEEEEVYWVGGGILSTLLYLSLLWSTQRANDSYKDHLYRGQLTQVYWGVWLYLYIFFIVLGCFTLDYRIIILEQKHPPDKNIRGRKQEWELPNHDNLHLDSFRSSSRIWTQSSWIIHPPLIGSLLTYVHAQNSSGLSSFSFWSTFVNSWHLESLLLIKLIILWCVEAIGFFLRGGGGAMYDNVICEAGSRLPKVSYLVWCALSTPPTVWWGQLLICSRPLWRWCNDANYIKCIWFKF